MSSSRHEALRQRVVAAPPLSLCLDFANTRFWRGTAAPTESLPEFDALLRWLGEAGVVDAESAPSLRALGEVDQAAAGRLFDASLDAREVLYRLFSALASESRVDAELRSLNALLGAAPARVEVVMAGRQTGWRVPMVAPTVGEVLSPILWSAADLTLAVHRVRLRACANEKCRWLFLDDSKTGTRRWCSMASCGNRAKVQRHFLRTAGKAR